MKMLDTDLPEVSLPSRTNFDSPEFLMRLRAVDEEAWKLLTAEARRRLEAYFVVIELAHQAEDLASQTLVRLIKSKFMDYESDRSSVLTWVINTGKLIAREYVKKETRRRKLLLKHYKVTVSDSNADEERSGESRLGKLARRALESLSDNERYILVLRFGEGLSFELIAEILETSQGNARARVVRARDKLILEFERLHPLESRKRILRSGLRNTYPSASSPPGRQIPVAPAY